MSTFRAVHSIHQTDAGRWQNLYRQLTPQGYPFLDRRFLAALEDSGCIGTRSGHASGWQACYLQGEPETNDIIIPCYIKQHSYGEYVFDWSWAEAYQRYRLDYYPKLLWAIPFTPASGPRLLGDNRQLPQALAAVQAFTAEQSLSGWHLNFTDTASNRILTTASNTPSTAVSTPVRRYGCQFHWFNEGYQSFDDYLQHFVSRKRKAVRRERLRVTDQGIRLQRKTGTQISADDIHMFCQCYADTYQRRHSTPYLNEAFFQQLRQTMSEKMLLVTAERGQHTIACALYFFDQETLYGRYWGALEDIDALHFEACYYQGIEFCIEQGLQRFDPGTQGEHKISRGFRPVLTHSFHQLQHPQFHEAVQQFAAEEQDYIRRYHAEAETLLPFHRG